MSIIPTQPAAMGIHYMYYPLEGMLQAQKRAGYNAIELWCAAPHVLLTPEGVADRAQTVHTIKESGMKLVCVTPENCMYPWQFAARGDSLITQSRAYFLHGLELASELESPYMAVNSGWGLVGEDASEAMKRSLAMIDWLCDMAKPLGVTLVMESLRSDESNLVNSLASTKRFLDTLNRDNLKPMIDTCAMSVAGESIEDWFEVFGSDIAHMHFVDGTPYGHLAWGDGDRDLNAYLAAIEKYGYTGALTQEITDGRYYETPEAADRKSIAVLSKYMA